MLLSGITWEAGDHIVTLENEFPNNLYAPWFARGFAPALKPCAEAPPIRESGTWLGSVGWRRHGLLRVDERPRAPR